MSKILATGALALGLITATVFALPAPGTSPPTTPEAPIIMQDEAAAVASPSCCVKRAYCCTVKRSCCP